MGTRPVPSTGPYMIESYVPARALTLVRNPYFRVSSRAARPDGFPDEIQFRMVGPEGVTAVDRGRADVALIASTETRGRQGARGVSSALRRRRSTCTRSRRRSYSSSIRHILRSTMSGCGARSTTPSTVPPSPGRTAALAEPTCQPRPPGTVGFQRYCPYTAAPSRTGEWKAPDLERARRLVAASGTRGMKRDGLDVPRLLGVGRRGGGPSARGAGVPGEHQASQGPRRLRRESDRREDAGRAGRDDGLVRPPRTASFLLDLFQVQPTQSGASSAIGGSTPGSRGRSRSRPPTRTPRRRCGRRIERDIVDLAPEVPLFTPSDADRHLQARRQLPVQPRVGDPARSALGSIVRQQGSASSSPRPERRRRPRHSPLVYLQSICGFQA